jgi:hypothetical protein
MLDVIGAIFATGYFSVEVGLLVGIAAARPMVKLGLLARPRRGWQCSSPSSRVAR